MVVDLGANADEATARQAIRDDRVDLAVVIPDGFAAGLSTGTGTLVVLTAGVNSAQEGGYVGDLQSAIGDAVGALAPPGTAVPHLAIEHQVVYGSADADVLDLFAPAFVAFFSYFFVFVLTGVSFLRERVGGTLERLLATPVTRGEIVTGYSLGFGLLAVGPGRPASHLAPLAGHRPVDRAAAVVHHRTRRPDRRQPGARLRHHAAGRARARSTWASSCRPIARTELQIIQFIPIVIVPQALLSGVLFPVAALPPILQPISHLMPMTYAIEGLRQVMIKGADAGINRRPGRPALPRRRGGPVRRSWRPGRSDARSPDAVRRWRRQRVPACVGSSGRGPRTPA